MMKFLRIGDKKSNGLALIGVFSLLVLYLAATVEINLFHSALHASDEQALHSKSNESNACHQSVYHNQKEKSCKHKAHIVFVKKCPLCHLTFQSFHLHNAKASLGFTPSSKEVRGDGQILIASSATTLLPSRAPPVV